MIFDLINTNKIACIEDSDRKITYKELNEKYRELSTYIDKRSVVFSFCQNKIGSIIGYVSFLNNHSVPLLLNSSLDIELVNTMLVNYKPSFLWMPMEMKAKFLDYNEVYRAFDYVLLKSKYDINHTLNDELALLLSTSGSTGTPKLVRQSYSNIISNTKSIIEYLELDESEMPITTLPMNYTYGLSVINTHLFTGSTILLTDYSIMEKEFWNFLKKYGATSVAGVPYTYEMLDKLRIFNMDIPTVKTMTQAGGKLAPELHRKYAEYAKKHNKKFIVMYGQTEATARMSYLPHEKSIEKYGSIGIAIPGGKFHLIDINGDIITDCNTIGELVYEGENVTLGYAECLEDLALGDENNKKLITGDMAKTDEEGFYYIVGRKKRFLKIYGSRVNLDEVERMIKDKYLTECACTGSDDSLIIYITNENLTDLISSYVIETLGISKFAFSIKLITDIPKNESGKVQYSELNS